MNVSRSICACALALLFTVGCGSDDPTTPENNDSGNTGPEGTWEVTWSQMEQDCPTAELASLLVETALGLASPADNQWQVAVENSSGLELRQGPVCVPTVIDYEPTTRRMNEDLADKDITVPKTVIDQICGVIECPPELEEYSEFIEEVRISPRRQPDVTWNEDFTAFSGSYTLSGEVIAVASVPIIGEIEIPLGECSTTWMLDGVRCDSCAPTCP